MKKRRIKIEHGSKRKQDGLYARKQIAIIDVNTDDAFNAHSGTLQYS